MVSGCGCCCFGDVVVESGGWGNWWMRNELVIDRMDSWCGWVINRISMCVVCVCMRVSVLITWIER